MQDTMPDACIVVLFHDRNRRRARVFTDLDLTRQALSQFTCGMQLPSDRSRALPLDVARR